MESTATRMARERVVNPAKTSDSIAPRSAGYGMPCAECHAYYPSDMAACPICKSPERLSPTANPKLPTLGSTPEAEAAKLLAEERERLRELKSQIYASNSQVPATTFRCALDQNHNGNAEPAAVCHSCYGESRQLADRLEAALHIDLKEAAKIVYEAVWKDTSDPSKTYANAAAALLSELRQRAGISAVLGPNQPRPH